MSAGGRGVGRCWVACERKETGWHDNSEVVVEVQAGGKRRRRSRAGVMGLGEKGNR